MDAQLYERFAISGFCMDHLMAMDSAPCWNILQRTRVGTHHFESLTCLEFRNLLTGADHWHRTDQVSGIQYMVYTYHGFSISAGFIGVTVKSRALPSAAV